MMIILMCNNIINVWNININVMIILMCEIIILILLIMCNIIINNNINDNIMY